MAKDEKREKQIQMSDVNNEKYPIKSIVVAMSSDPLPSLSESERMEVDFRIFKGTLFYNIKLLILGEEKKLRIAKMLPEVI